MSASKKMYAPWCVGAPNEEKRTIGIRDDADFVIAEMCDDTAYSDADMKERARLIAAAPRMLEALQVLSEEADNFSVSGVYFNEKCMGHRGLELAAAAIAAATGETK